jgi:predicted GIY-YIG superfamily endonuclease
VFSSRNEVRGKFNSNENSKPFFKIENAPPMVMNLAQSFLNEVINIKEYEPTIDFANDIEKEECYVYLMHDTTNNYYKIGISNNPNYRERTLQSEKPTIELIASKKFPSRLIVLSIEKALHESFKTKNIRGEWFNLNQSDVEDIIKTLI